MTDVLDLVFPVRANKPIPDGMGYTVFSALSRVAPVIHEDRAIGIHSIRGTRIGTDRLRLEPSTSALRIRTPFNRVRDLLQIAGKRILLGDAFLCLGIPRLYALRPVSALVSRIVSIKGFLEPEPFRLAVERQLVALNLQSSPEVHIGRRRVLRIKNRVIVGFAVHLRALTEADSLVIQAQGLGGRRHFGCGLFVPLTHDSRADRGDQT